MYIKIIESIVILPVSPSNSLTPYFSSNCNFISKRARRLFTHNDQRSSKTSRNVQRFLGKLLLFVFRCLISTTKCMTDHRRSSMTCYKRSRRIIAFRDSMRYDEIYDWPVDLFLCKLRSITLPGCINCEDKIAR